MQPAAAYRTIKVLCIDQKMSTSQTRDGKNYVCSLSRKVHMHANGNRYRRDAIKHPASTVRSHSLLGNIVENLWSLQADMETFSWNQSIQTHCESMCFDLPLTVISCFLGWFCSDNMKPSGRGRRRVWDIWHWFKMCQMTRAVSAYCDESSNITYPTLGNVISGQLSHFGSSSPTVSS